MPIPNRRRLNEYTVKGVHLAARRIGQAPEQQIARLLARQAPAATPGGPRVLFLTAKDWSAHVQWEGMMAHALRLRPPDVSFFTSPRSPHSFHPSNTSHHPPI